MEDVQKSIEVGVKRMNDPKVKQRIGELAVELHNLLAPGATVSVTMNEPAPIIVPGKPSVNSAHLQITRPIVLGPLVLNMERPGMPPHKGNGIA